MLSEPYATGTLLIVFGLLMTISALLTRAANRVGIPVVLLFLALGMLGGSEGLGRIAFDDFEIAFRLGVIALILILFDGGLNTSAGSLRASLAPSGVLATVGVLGTAAAMACVGRLLGLSWAMAFLIGAIVSSTDAAAVFAVLRGGGVRVHSKVRSALEVESCVNDPMAMILTIAAVDTIQSGAPSWMLLVDVPVQLIVGAAAGTGIGFSARWLLRRLPAQTAGLFPVVTLAAAFVSFGAATALWGSGFLAVFATGAVLGNGPMPYKGGLTRVHDAFAWFSQVALFLMLGLLVFPSRLLPVAGEGLLLGLALAIVARPLVVGLCMSPFRWRPRETAYVSWVGIRGAVPIVLAMFPVMADLPRADELFHTVFFIVVVSSLIPGASIVPLTRRLKLEDPSPPLPAAALEMHSLEQLDGEIRVYHITPAVAVCGAQLSQIQFPEHAAAILIVRHHELIAAKGQTQLLPGDHIYIFCRHEDAAYVDLLFGRPLQE